MKDLKIVVVHCSMFWNYVMCSWNYFEMPKEVKAMHFIENNWNIVHYEFMINTFHEKKVDGALAIWSWEKEKEKEVKRIFNQEFNWVSQWRKLFVTFMSRWYQSSCDFEFFFFGGLRAAEFYVTEKF